MQVNTESLIADLIDKTKHNLNLAEKLKKQNLEILNHRVSPGTWTVLECIEHLNIYGTFYISEIENRINKSKYKEDDVFKSGPLGNYFANLMQTNAKQKKLKTPKDNNPIGKRLEASTIDRFINQQHTLLTLLNKARQVSLVKTKTGISITRVVKLRLGDTLRFVVYHNIRHLKQAENILKII